MAKTSKTTYTVSSKNQKYLETLQDEVETYQGLRTELLEGELVIYLIDSASYWRKRDRAERKKEKRQLQAV